MNDDQSNVRIDHPLAESVFQSLGAASMCWHGGTGSAVFDSERAARFGEELLSQIIERETHVTETAAYAMSLAVTWQNLAIRAEDLMENWTCSPSDHAELNRWRDDYMAAVHAPLPPELHGGG